MNTNTPIEAPLLSWAAPEQPTHVRSTLWYIVAGVFFASLLAYSIMTQAWTFTVVLVLSVGAYGYAHRKAPPLRRINVSERGIIWGKTFISWLRCEGFWLLQGPGYVELHVELKDGRTRHLVIQTGEADPVQIYTVFSRFIPLFPDRHEKLLDAIIRICKI